MRRWARVITTALLLCAWVVGGAVVAVSVVFFGPSLGGVLQILIPVGSSYKCNTSPWVWLELFLVLGYIVGYTIVVPLLTFSRMINWASSTKIGDTSRSKSD